MSADSFQVGPETFVTLTAQVFDAEGESASEPETTAFVFGLGQLLPKLERALEGKLAGDVVEVELAEKDAFGPRDSKGILEVDRSDFPDEVSPGDRFEVENVEGGLLVLHVLDVSEECVVVDTNHPLAGQDVKFVLKLHEVRPASEEEMSAALTAMEEDSQFLTVDCPDVSASRLIRGPAAR